MHRAVQRALNVPTVVSNLSAFSARTKITRMHNKHAISVRLSTSLRVTKDFGCI